MRLSRSLPAALLVLTLPLAACSDGEADSEPTAASSSAAPTDDPADDTTDAPADEPADDAEDAVDGDGQEVETDLVVFDAPADWDVVDPQDFTDNRDGQDLEDDPAGAELTDKLGISGDQLLQMMSQADLIVLSGTGSVAGFIDNLNVVHYPGEVPTSPELQEQLTAQYEALGATGASYTTVQTDAGEGLLVEYVLPLQGNEVQGRAVLVASGSDVVSVTVSALDAGLADEVAARVVATLRTAG